MAGHMQKRGESTWRLYVFIGQDNNGRRRYVSRTFHGSKKQASTALAAFVTEAVKDRNASAAAGPITVSLVLEQWLDSRRAQLFPATTDRYRVAIKHIDPVIGSMKVGRLRPHHIEDLYAALYAQGQSGPSIRKAHWALRQSLAWAHRRGYSSIVATEGIELPPLGAKEIEPPTSANVRKVIDTLLAKDPDWGTLVAVVAWTGCRRGEVAGLKWEDVNLSQGNLLIRRAVATIPGGIQIKGTKTGDIRHIAIGPRTVELLAAHKGRCEDRARHCGVAIGSSAYIFSPDPASSRPYNPYTITRTFVNACKNAGVPPIRLHDLRHHSVTTSLERWIDCGRSDGSAWLADRRNGQPLSSPVRSDGCRGSQSD
jgi:integrase